MTLSIAPTSGAKKTKKNKSAPVIAMAFETGAIRSCATVYVLTMLAMTLGLVVFDVSVALK